MNFFRYIFGRGRLRESVETTVDASNFLAQSEQAFKDMPYVLETIKKEWLDKGYKVTDEFGDSIVIEKKDK